MTCPSHRLSLAALSLGLLLAAGCSGAGAEQPAPIPPPDTGQLVTDMDGEWMISELERLDASGQPLPFAYPSAHPFLAVQMGQVIEIEQGRAIDRHTREPLYEQFGHGVPNRRYLNVADGRTWLLRRGWWERYGGIPPGEVPGPLAPRRSA